MYVAIHQVPLSSVEPSWPFGRPPHKDKGYRSPSPCHEKAPRSDPWSLRLLLVLGVRRIFDSTQYSSMVLHEKQIVTGAVNQ